MNLSKIAFCWALSASLLSVSVAQSAVTGLHDLEGVRSAMGEFQLKRRGYVFSHSDKASHASFHYYAKDGQCVVVEEANGRYESIAEVPADNCNNSAFQYDQATYDPLRELVGLPAQSGSQQLQSRGYTFARAEKFSHSDFHYYSNNRDCIAVEVSDGRYQGIRQTVAANCGSDASNISKSPAAITSTVDYPRVQADTDGGGSYYVPGVSSSQADAGMRGLRGIVQ